MRSRLGSLSSLGLGSVNLALLSFYFFPVWGRDAVQALVSPYNGLNERVHATAAIYFSQLFDLSFSSLVVASHVLAGVKLVIAAAFVAYIIEFTRSWAIRREPDRETVDVVLILAVVGILLHAVPALTLGEPSMVRLYATQMLLIAGAITVIVVERHVTLAPKPARLDTAMREGETLGLGLPVGALSAGPPPARMAAAPARIPEAHLRSR
jgi:hypothetical protein